MFYTLLIIFLTPESHGCKSALFTRYLRDHHPTRQTPLQRLPSCIMASQRVGFKRPRLRCEGGTTPLKPPKQHSMKLEWHIVSPSLSRICPTLRSSRSGPLCPGPHVLRRDHCIIQLHIEVRVPACRHVAILAVDRCVRRPPCGQLAKCVALRMCGASRLNGLVLTVLSRSAGVP